MNRQVKTALLAAPILALALAGCQSTSTSGQSPPKAPATATTSSGHTITYRVTGTAQSVSVTYTDASASIAQEASDPVPYTKTLTIPRHTFAVLTLEAQNLGASGNVTCSISVDGKQRKSSTSLGGYQVCIVSDSL